MAATEREDLSLDEVSQLLLELADEMHRAQVPSNVIEGVLTGIGARFGAQVDLMLFQSYQALGLRRGAAKRLDLRRISFEAVWRLERVLGMLKLARGLADGSIALDDGRAALARIKEDAVPRPKWVVVLAYAVYGGVVAAKVGGDWIELAAAVPLGFVTGLFTFAAQRYRRIALQQTFLAGAIGSLVVLALTLILPPFSLAPAIFGGVALLLPAVMVTIATHELANDALESGTIRLVYGLLRFAMLGAGIAAGLAIWQLGAPLPLREEPGGLSSFELASLVTIGGFALVIVLHARTRDVGWVVGAALLAWGTQELTAVLFGGEGSPFISAFLLGAAAHLQARLSNHAAATMIVPGLFQLAPGFLGTTAVLRLLAGQPGGGETFFQMLLVASQLVLGLLVSDALFRRPPK